MTRADYDKLISGYPAIQLDTGKWVAFYWDGSSVNATPLTEKQLRTYLEEA